MEFVPRLPVLVSALLFTSSATLGQQLDLSEPWLGNSLNCWFESNPPPEGRVSHRHKKNGSTSLLLDILVSLTLFPALHCVPQSGSGGFDPAPHPQWPATLDTTQPPPDAFFPCSSATNCFINSVALWEIRDLSDSAPTFLGGPGRAIHPQRA